jgi:hypothetical protein
MQDYYIEAIQTTLNAYNYENLGIYVNYYVNPESDINEDYKDTVNKLISLPFISYENIEAILKKAKSKRSGHSKEIADEYIEHREDKSIPSEGYPDSDIIESNNENIEKEDENKIDSNEIEFESDFSDKIEIDTSSQKPIFNPLELFILNGLKGDKIQINEMNELPFSKKIYFHYLSMAKQKEAIYNSII